MEVQNNNPIGKKIRIGIVGYGNLGRGAEYTIAKTADMELHYIFTRRDPSIIKPKTQGVKVLNIEDVSRYVDDIDVMLLCGSSSTDLPVQTPMLAKLFNVVDSYDTHIKIQEHYTKTDEAAKCGGKVAIISAGWDPGVFSLNRVMSDAILPDGQTYSFWGEGVSQGHSDVLRNIDGVIDARQYTVPVESALKAVRSGVNPELTSKQKHKRICYLVVKENADLIAIENEIVNMPYYFADNETIVHFISAEELEKEHSGMPHGGLVIRSGNTGFNNSHNHIIEYNLKIDYNPEFTASVMTAYARAAYRLNSDGVFGCKTVPDIPPAYISPKTNEELRENYI
jgi:diaminopimelate dehydrogenase